MTGTAYQQRAPLCDYLQVTLTAPRQLEELLTVLLLDFGAEGVEVIDNALIMAHLQAGDWDASVFDGADLPIERLSLRTLLPLTAENRAACVALRSQAEAYAGVEVDIQLQAAVDWQEKWKEGLAAHPVGERLWLRPYWDASPCPDGRVELVIDPGMAFGTGEHATTELCLLAMEEYIDPGHKIIDFGCGSGILAIAGLRLGAQTAVGVDIDPICEQAVERHRQINNIAPEQLIYHTGDILADEKLQRGLRRDKAQLVVANITADVLRDLAGIVGRFMAPGGYFICSGVLKDYGGDVAKALIYNGMAIISQRQRGEWLCFIAVPAYE